MDARSSRYWLLGIFVLMASCASVREPASNDLGGLALLRGTQRGLIELRTTELFAVDGRRTLDREWVLLAPGPHEVEFAMSNFHVRRLRFEAKAGVKYALDHSWINDDLRYWVAESVSGTTVAAGDDSLGDAVQRHWFIDDFRGALGGTPARTGNAEFLAYNEERITVSGAHSDPEFPSRRPGHLVTYEDETRAVPAGTWVVEIHENCLGMGCNYYGRLVASFGAGQVYGLEHEFKYSGITASWLVDARSGTRLQRFNTCKADWVGPSFSACEVERNAKLHYAGVEPGDPRFWWGDTGMYPEHRAMAEDSDADYGTDPGASASEFAVVLLEPR